MVAAVLKNLASWVTIPPVPGRWSPELAAQLRGGDWKSANHDIEHASLAVWLLCLGKSDRACGGEGFAG